MADMLIPKNIVYTSYFGYKTTFQQASIALYTPKWFNGPRLTELAPTPEILALKDCYQTYLPRYIRYLTWVGYKKIYTQLATLTNDFKDPIVLCCYEKLNPIEYGTKFCHRTIIREWLNTIYSAEIYELGWTEPVRYASVDTMRIYLEEAKFRMTFEQNNRLKEFHTNLLIDRYGKDILTYTGAYLFHDGPLALKASSRIVIGAHGPYIEFDESHTCFELCIPPSETWRLNTDRYNVKYLHYTIPERTGLKIYKQLKPVSYADYKPNLYYIDLYKLTPCMS